MAPNKCLGEITVFKKSARPPGIPENWAQMSFDVLYAALNTPRATPRTTTEAVIESVRVRGLGALDARRTSNA